MNEFIYAFTFISSSEQRTVSAGVPNDLIRGDVFFWQSLMAAALIPAIPLALLYNAFLDRFIKGRPTLDEVEERYIDLVLEEQGGDKVKAAQVLGISTRTLYRREKP